MQYVVLSTEYRVRSTQYEHPESSTLNPLMVAARCFTDLQFWQLRPPVV